MTPPAGPDFIGIGAQRSGTTWIYRALNQHPQIAFGARKEIEFFNDARSFYIKGGVSNYAKGVDWYRDQLQLQATQRCGDISPDYMWDSAASARIHEHVPDVKIIASLRHPVDRAWSQFMAASHYIHIADTFEEALSKHPELLERGLYFAQLKPYFDHFPSTRIKIILLDDIIQSPQSALSELHGFLDVERLPAESLEPTNTSGDAPRHSLTFRLLSRTRRLADTSWGARLWTSRGFAGIKNSALKALDRFHPREKSPQYLTQEIRERHAPYFKEDVAQLESLIQRDLSCWKL
jgi:hypothetical protein